MKPLTYIYPKSQRPSFKLIAQQHIKQLRKRGVEVIERDIKYFTEKDVGEVTVTHPMFYPVIDAPFKVKWLIRRAKKLIGFDVCDSDRITDLASYIANMYDLVCVPSKFCKEVYRQSGVFSRIEVIPHGVDDAFFREPREPRDPDVRKVAEKRGVKILYFLWHSGFRKGCDVVAEAFARLLKDFDNVHLIVKLSGLFDPFIQFLLTLKNVVIFNKWLNIDDLVDLYDVCDIVITPSRSGGFELNALEALARGKIVIVSQWGAFDDYCRECLRVSSKSLVDVFLGDNISKKIHCGKGVNPDPNDLYHKLRYAITMKNILEKKYMVLQRIVKENYNWNVIGEKLFETLKPYLE